MNRNSQQIGRGCFATTLGTGLVLVGIVLLVAGFFLFRGEQVVVPNAHVAKVKSSSGFEPGLRGPSIFRLPLNLFGANPTKLVLAEVCDNRVVEDVQNLFMPADKLNLGFQIVSTLAVSNDEKKINTIYDRVPPADVQGSSAVKVITFQQVYSTYGQQAIRTIAQEIVAQYSIDYVLRNLDKVSQEIQKKVNERLADTPLSIRYCGLGAVAPPKLIIDAQEQARKRQIEIETATAQKLVDLTNADAEYQVGLKRQQVDLMNAETQAMINLVLSDSISQPYIAQRALAVLDALAEDENASFLLTTKIFEDPATLLGLSKDDLQALTHNDAEREKKLKEITELLDTAKREAEKQIEKAMESTPPVTPQAQEGSKK